MKVRITLLLLALALAFGCAYAQSGEVADLKSLIEEEPKNTEAWIKLGNVMMDSGKYSEAIEAYGRALELDPSNVNVRVDRGSCYRNIGRSDLAVEHYRKGIEIDPKHAYAHYNLAVVLTYDFEDYAGGLKEFERFLELKPDDPQRAEIEKIIAELKAFLKESAQAE